MMDEAGFLFTGGMTPELTESKFLGKAMSKKIKINDKEEVELLKPSFLSTVHEKVLD